MNPRELWLAAALFLCIGTAAAAEPLDASRREAVIAQLSAALKANYVDPTIGAKAGDRISANLRAGEYDSLSDGAEFARRLTDDIWAIAHDKHLRVLSRAAPPPRPPGPARPRSEAGIVRADRLQGGIGYIEVATFPTPPLFKPTLDRAMQALASSRALVIDVRRNGGYSPAGAAYLISFLLPPGRPIQIEALVERTPGTTTFTRQSLDSVPTPVNFAGRPVVILTSQSTFSAGEQFAYDAQNLNVAAVVGEVTGGGANQQRSLQIGSDLMAAVPYGKAESPVTGTNWEGSGVRPDTMAPADDALRVALLRLGSQGAGDVATASEQQVFAPRSTPIPGSEAKLRGLLVSLNNGAPDYATLGPALAESTRKGTSDAGQLAALGEIKQMAFLEVGPSGDDVFEITFSGGVRRTGIALAADGKILAWGFY